METIKNDITSIEDITPLLPLFGVESLREAQKGIVSSLLFEKGDLLSIVPTGGGKTLCFQIAAYYQKGLTIIIYPLLSLMRDQKKRFSSPSSNAVILEGGQTKEVRDKIFKELREKRANVIITNPEVLSGKKMQNALKEFDISLFVIDEAHTVVEWGETFREAFLNLKEIIEVLTPGKIAAFTATSSPYVTGKLFEYVFFRQTPKVIRFSANRENIMYHRVKTISRRESLMYLINKVDFPLLVFVRTRNETKTVARFLAEIAPTHPVRFYHAGLPKSEKLEIEKWYYPSNDGILVATCAFGMGVDKKNIRTVIHIKPPENASLFLQESGRGGRDGKTAHSYVIVKMSDRKNRNGTINHLAEIFLDENVSIRKALLNEMGEDTTSLKTDENETEKAPYEEYKYEIMRHTRLERGYFTKNTLSKLLKTDKGALLSSPKKLFLSWGEKSIREGIESLIEGNALLVIKENLYPSPLKKTEEIVKKMTIFKDNFIKNIKNKLKTLISPLR